MVEAFTVEGRKDALPRHKTILFYFSNSLCRAKVIPPLSQTWFADHLEEEMWSLFDQEKIIYRVTNKKSWRFIIMALFQKRSIFFGCDKVIDSANVGGEKGLDVFTTRFIWNTFGKKDYSGAWTFHKDFIHIMPFSTFFLYGQGGISPLADWFKTWRFMELGRLCNMWDPKQHNRESLYTNNVDASSNSIHSVHGPSSDHACNSYGYPRNNDGDCYNDIPKLLAYYSLESG